MAGKGGGGSWKVAYADFVTALMAFFLVMWICAQDQQTRESVAHYFNEPFQFFKDPIGSNRQPEKSGAMFKSKTMGHVPDSDAVVNGRGRESFTPSDTTSPATKTVSGWLHANEKASRYWHEKAVEALKAASQSDKARGNSARLEEMATQILAEQLEDEMKKDTPSRGGANLQDDLLAQALADVNWTELAEDLIRQERLPPP